MAELRNANIGFVSLVDRAANMKKFAIIKSENGQIESYCPIIKVNEEKQEVTAIVYEPLEKDSQNDHMTVEEVEKAQRSHAMNGFNTDVQHSFQKEAALTVVESWITKEDSIIGEQEIKKGTWMETLHVGSDDIWKSVKAGDFTGFSMGGTGEKIEEVKKNESILKKFAKFLGIQKGTFSDTLNEGRLYENYYDLTYALQRSLKINGDEEQVSNEEIKAILEEFSSSVYKLLENKEETITMENIKKEDLQVMIDEAIEKKANPELSVQEEIAKALKEAGVIKDEQGTEVEKSELEKRFDAMEEKLMKSLDEEKPKSELEKRFDKMEGLIEKMATARGMSKSVETLPATETTKVRKSDEEVFNGIFIKGDVQ